MAERDIKMEKTQLNTITVLAFCSALLDFMLSDSNNAVFTRDRIIHILISAVIFFVLAWALNSVDFEKKHCRPLIIVLIFSRILFLMYKFMQYQSVFHSSDIISFILLTAVTAVFAIKLAKDNIGQLYGFFLLLNVLFLSITVILCAGRLNVANLYANDVGFRFSYDKLFCFFDVFTVAFAVPEGSERMYVQKRYIFVSSAVFAVIALLQGLCVNGNMMYSISPLQSLFQIFSGSTVKRFDFVLSIVQTINYFAVISMYIWCIGGNFLRERD